MGYLPFDKMFIGNFGSALNTLFVQYFYTRKLKQDAKAAKSIEDAKIATMARQIWLLKAQMAHWMARVMEITRELFQKDIQLQSMRSLLALTLGLLKQSVEYSSQLEAQEASTRSLLEQAMKIISENGAELASMRLMLVQLLEKSSQQDKEASS